MYLFTCWMNSALCNYKNTRPQKYIKGVSKVQIFFKPGVGISGEPTIKNWKPKSGGRGGGSGTKNFHHFRSGPVLSSWNFFQIWPAAGLQHKWK